LSIAYVKVIVFVTGQYPGATKKSHPVVKYILPGLFDDLRKRAMDPGFGFVASGLLVRRSMNDEEI